MMKVVPSECIVEFNSMLTSFWYISKKFCYPLVEMSSSLTESGMQRHFPKLYLPFFVFNFWFFPFPNTYTKQYLKSMFIGWGILLCGFCSIGHFMDQWLAQESLYAYLRSHVLSVAETQMQKTLYKWNKCKSQVQMKVWCSWSTLMLETGHQVRHATEHATFSLTKYHREIKLVNPWVTEKYMSQDY